MPDLPVASPLRMVEPAAPADAPRRVLARDGRDLVLQPWQAAWLIATADGREGFVPPGCGVGAGWLAARLDEERAAG